MFNANLLVAENITRLAKNVCMKCEQTLFTVRSYCVFLVFEDDPSVHVMPRKPNVCFCNVSFFWINSFFHWCHQALIYQLLTFNRVTQRPLRLLLDQIKSCPTLWSFNFMLTLKRGLVMIGIWSLQAQAQILCRLDC